MRHRAWREWSIILEGGVQYICLVGCKIKPVDGYVPVCLVLTIDVYVRTRFDCLFTFISLKKVKFAQSWRRIWQVLWSTNWDSLFIIPVTSREGIFRYFFLQGQFEKSSKHWWYYVALNLWKSHVVDVIKLFGGNLDSPKSWNSIKFVLMPEPAQKCQNNAILS